MREWIDHEAEAEQYVDDYRQKALLRDGRVRGIRIVEEIQ